MMSVRPYTVFEDRDDVAALSSTLRTIDRIHENALGRGHYGPEDIIDYVMDRAGSLKALHNIPGVSVEQFETTIQVLNRAAERKARNDDERSYMEY